MNSKRIYRTANQEAIRKGLIAKLWALARQYEMEREDLYDAIAAEARRKPHRGVVLYGTNMTEGTNGKGKRVSISSLRIWQLKQIIGALFPGENRKNEKNGKYENDEKGKEKQNGARVIEFEDWRGSKKK